MGDKVNLTNSTYNLAELNRSIDNSFSYFTDEASPEDTDTVQELFRLYNKLYLEIPTTGQSSHETLVTRSSQIFKPGEDPVISLLQNEIADLRRQLLEANETIADLSDINTNIAGLTTNG